MPGAYVAPDVRVGTGVTIGHNAVVLANSTESAPTMLGDRVVVGANATVLPGVVVGVEGRVEPGSVVTKSVPARAIVAGNPAVIVGYADNLPTLAAPSVHGDALVKSSTVLGVSLHTLRAYGDLTGTLAVAEFGTEIPFRPMRYFFVYGVPSEAVRGAHAHRTCEQLLVAVRGQVHVIVDDGNSSDEFVLDDPRTGLYVPAMVWAIQYRYSNDAVVLVFASEPYDADEYIRDYDQFRAAANSNQSRRGRSKR